VDHATTILGDEFRKVLIAGGGRQRYWGDGHGQQFRDFDYRVRVRALIPMVDFVAGQ
jgi:hypothetical protein